ncbi:hypothetical protein QCN32_gp40 [Arthrobacter phage Niktson]|nr:hypothetical protein QCN32_gp40 [Arthrobacter phage Niktson]ASD52265.1 hypothetical protein NIKTSON_40 [Arthrobacter phage Niktson]ASD52358.1 hypothetical protein ELEPHANTMAN_40 [Arthrobacter phage ElephantMan]
MFNALKTAIVANQDTIVRRSLGLGSIAAGMAINSMLNKPKATANVVVVEAETVVVEETNTDEPATEEVK